MARKEGKIENELERIFEKATDDAYHFQKHVSQWDDQAIDNNLLLEIMNRRARLREAIQLLNTTKLANFEQYMKDITDINTALDEKFKQIIMRNQLAENFLTSLMGKLEELDNKLNELRGNYEEEIIFKNEDLREEVIDSGFTFLEGFQRLLSVYKQCDDIPVSRDIKGAYKDTFQRLEEKFRRCFYSFYPLKHLLASYKDDTYQPEKYWWLSENPIEEAPNDHLLNKLIAKIFVEIREFSIAESCPSSDELIAYSLNELALGRRRIIENHLLICFKCLDDVTERRLQNLKPSESLMSKYTEAIDELRSRALKLAYETRTCPGDKLLFSKKKNPHLIMHLRQCESCQNRIEFRENIFAWKFIANKIKVDLKVPSTGIEKIHSPGQIRSVSKKFNDWGDKNRFYNAPTVLLIEPDDNGKQKSFRVAQIYSDKAMMTQGGIWIGEEYGFAESWNIYSIPVRYLEQYWGEVDNKLIQEIKKESKRELLPSVVQDDVFLFFRNLEKDIGSFFIHAITEEERRIEWKKSRLKRFAARAKEEIGRIIEGLRNPIDFWTPPWQPQSAGEMPSASDAPEQTETFSLECGDIRITMYWAPADREALAFVIINWVKKFVSSDDLWIRFIDPETNEVRRDINLGASQEGEASYDSNTIGFDPWTQKWAISVVLMEPPMIVDGVEVAFTKEHEPMLILSEQGLRNLSYYFAPEFTKDADSTLIVSKGAAWSEKEKERLEKLRQSFPILPVAVEPVSDKALRITFKRVGDMPDKKPKVYAAVKDKSIPQKNIRWEIWPSSTPVLVLRNCEMPKEEIKDKRSLAISVSTQFNVLILNLL